MKCVMTYDSFVIFRNYFTSLKTLNGINPEALSKCLHKYGNSQIPDMQNLGYADQSRIATRNISGSRLTK